jgi:hypothetical protein
MDYPGEREPGIHWIGGWVKTALLDETENREKIPAPVGNQNLVVHL